MAVLELSSEKNSPEKSGSEKNCPWLIDAINRADVNAVTALTDTRNKALSYLQEQQWPTRKTEAWKYLSLSPLADKSFKTDYIDSDANHGLESLNALVINVSKGLEQFEIANLPTGLEVFTLSNATTEQVAWIKETLGTVKPSHHYFGAANDLLAADVLVIDVAENTRDLPIIHLVQQAANNLEQHCRVLVRIAAQAKLTVIEHNQGIEQSFNTLFAEYDLAESAELEHYRFALQQQQAMMVAGCHFKLADKAQLNSSIIGFGSELARLDVDVHHAGSYAHAEINAVYLLDESEVFDLHSCIEHAVANGTTEENIRGIVAENSKAIFNGRIHIHRDAQKTLAELNNRNLLLSRNAELYTKPELEIYADDVRCAHGATVAEIDKKSLYYLQSRGIPKHQALVMLNFGFINELIDKMPNQQIAEWLRPQLQSRFTEMSQEQA